MISNLHPIPNTYMNNHMEIEVQPTTTEVKENFKSMLQKYQIDVEFDTSAG